MKSGRIFAWIVELGNGLMGSWMGKQNRMQNAERRETRLVVSSGSRAVRRRVIGASVLIMALYNRENRYRKTEGSARRMRMGGSRRGHRV